MKAIKETKAFECIL